MSLPRPLAGASFLSFSGSGFTRVLNGFGGTRPGEAFPQGKPWDRQPVSGKLRRKLGVSPGFAAYRGTPPPKPLSTRFTMAGEYRSHGRYPGGMDNLQGKVALVTGSSRGIGRAIAVALARAGADLAINYRTRAADAKDAASEIAGFGRRCVAIQADVSVRAGVDRLVDAVQTELGHIEILVNNAGVARVQSIEEITEQDWDELIAVNLKSCFLMTQAVLPGMRARRWGRIINLSSVAAHVGGVRFAVGDHHDLLHVFALALQDALRHAEALARIGVVRSDLDARQLRQRQLLRRVVEEHQRQRIAREIGRASCRERV